MPMTSELRKHRDPIAAALETYQELSDGQITLDPIAARNLRPMPEKPYYARSDSMATLRDGTRVPLVTIAFEPEGATGDDQTFKMRDVWTSDLPRKTSLLPRDKSAVLAEVSLAICAHDSRQSQAEPTLYAGSLAVVGLVPKPEDVQAEVAIGRIGYVGQPTIMSMHGSVHEYDPVASITTGPVKGSRLDIDGERTGDPHAIYNAWNQFVVASFVSLPWDASSEAFASLQSLNPRLFD
ncbi:MAG TPA: hypothetical protein VLE74_03385 [Candidatus Saccharimonadales bacterium]|nr:hypothetical protein [Candidatus Saccharimonadales bacterium]